MRLIITIAFLALALSCNAQLRPQRPVNLFNGKDLNGWYGLENHWSVVDGIITGTTTEENSLEQNTFLICKTRPVEDFELTLKARVTGENNSGIQYRSRVVDKDKAIVAGYQLDIHPRPKLTGMIYEERGRDVLALAGQHVEIGQKKRTLGRINNLPPIDITAWNEYSITARGSRLIHRINGKVVATAIDTDNVKGSRRGIIALQLHAGPPMKLEAKDIVLRRLNRSNTATPRPSNLHTPSPRPDWITSSTPRAPEEFIFFRTSTKHGKQFESATLNIAADGSFTAFLNGEPVGTGQTNASFDVTPTFHQGINTLAIKLQDGDKITASLTTKDQDGTTTTTVTDRKWVSNTATQVPAEWNTSRLFSIPKARRNWLQCKVLGEAIDPFPQKALPDTFVTPGFKLEKIKDLPGSVISLTTGRPQRLFASDEDGNLYQIKNPDEPTCSVEKVDVKLPSAQGLVWAWDSLYAVANHPTDSGLYQVTDSDKDGQLDTSTLLKKFTGSGEHGPHGIVRGHDPQTLYIIAGNATSIPDNLAKSRPPQIWASDQLLPPPLTDPAKLPGGWICKTRPNGREWVLYSIGLRNAYDLAFNPAGQLFTADADSPNDSGTPFHRPLSIYNVPRGADLGARGLGQNFPTYYPDTIPPITTSTNGSPTGLTFGTGAAFPASYQRALFTCDWSNSTINVHHLTPTNTSYRSQNKTFIKTPDLPVTDITIADSGSLFFITGGRAKPSALWRVTYTGKEDTTRLTPQPDAPQIVNRRAKANQLGKLQDIEDPRVVSTAWPHLHTHAARTAIEHHDPETWIERFKTERDRNRILSAAIALARAGKPKHQPAVFQKLAELDFASLTTSEKIDHLRAHALTFLRLAAPTDSQSTQLKTQLTEHFSSGQSPLDLELAQMLIYLGDPSATPKTLALLTDENDPQIAATYASFLFHAKDGWTPEAKANYLAWLKKSPKQPSLQRLRSAFLQKESSKPNE